MPADNHSACCGTSLAPSIVWFWRNSMSWLFLSLLVVMGFALLKVRRRRKAKHVGSSYSDSKAA
jgi:hypothetical protein